MALYRVYQKKGQNGNTKEGKYRRQLIECGSLWHISIRMCPNGLATPFGLKERLKET